MGKDHKAIQIAFLIIISAILLVPAVSINTQSGYRSEIDNTMLAEFPPYDNGFFEGLNSYVEDRIGFRTQIITAYQELNIYLFHYLVHPLYEYGRDDWIMTRRWDQIQTLHLDVPEDYVDAFAGYVKKIEDVTLEHDAKFLFVLVPNKETIHYEKLSVGYNIYPSEITKSDRILSELDKEHIPHIYFKDLFMEHKNEIMLYNKKYDAGHWNENGTFLGLSYLYDYMIEDMGINIPPLDISDYEVSQQTMPYLLDSYIKINEQIPTYTLKNERYTLSEESFWDDFDMIKSSNYHTHTVNYSEDRGNKPKILIFGDSYLMLREKYFGNNFSEVTFLHRAESPKAEYYINMLHPDVVILEATERVIGPDQDCDMEFLESIYEYTDE